MLQFFVIFLKCTLEKGLGCFQQLWHIARCATPCSAHFSCTPMCHSPCCAPKTLQHCSSQASTWNLSDHLIFLPHHKTYMAHHFEASHMWPPKTFSALSHCPHSWPLHSPCSICCCFATSISIFYGSLLALLWMPDRPASLLCDASLTFLVYCCFFCSSSLFFS